MHNKNPIYQEFEKRIDIKILILKNLINSSQRGSHDYTIYQAKRDALEIAKDDLKSVIHDQQGCGKKKDKPKTEKCGHE